MLLILSGVDGWVKKLADDPSPGHLYEGKAGLEFANREGLTVRFLKGGSDFEVQKSGKWWRVEAKHMTGEMNNKFTPVHNSINRALEELPGTQDNIFKMAHEGAMKVSKGDIEGEIIAYLNTDGIDRAFHRIRYVEMTFSDGTTRYARLVSDSTHVWEWADGPFV